MAGMGIYEYGSVLKEERRWSVVSQLLFLDFVSFVFCQEVM